MESKAYSSGTSWSFPSHIGSRPGQGSSQDGTQMPGAFAQESEPAETTPPDQSATTTESRSSQPRPPPTHRRRQHWPPRTCRICLETVYPTLSTPAENIPEVLQPAPNVTYSSPELGRLLRPCRCKGSSKYVHEGCLQAWRHADPSYGKRNYWQCPTCSYRYKLERMNWGRWISSTATQLALTGLIFLVALFLMGFIADPIINFYSEPYAVFYAPSRIGERIEPLLSDDDHTTWPEHFLKGLASLGLLGFVKAIITLSPWNWFNIRVGGSGRSASGRDRLAKISWFVVVIGVCTFLWAVYKAVRHWSRRTLEKAGEKVMDVAGDDEDDDEDVPDQTETTAT